MIRIIRRESHAALRAKMACLTNREPSSYSRSQRERNPQQEVFSPPAINARDCSPGGSKQQLDEKASCRQARLRSSAPSRGPIALHSSANGRPAHLHIRRPNPAQSGVTQTPRGRSGGLNTHSIAPQHPLNVAFNQPDSLLVRPKAISDRSTLE